MKKIRELLTEDVINSQLNIGSKIIVCPVCGNETFDDYFICPTCSWEYDGSLNYSTTNKCTLKEYKEKYQKSIDS